MKTIISSTRDENGAAAAALGASRIRAAIKARGEANIIVATGASQFEMLAELVQATDIAWDRVTAFHLDEYVGLPITHPASFRAYLWERFHRRLPRPLRDFHYIAGDDNPEAECKRLNALIKRHPIDVCFAGIGENAHLAFNDPPADFKTKQPYLVVKLDDDCRQQQFGEGWFKSLRAVPAQAISMSIQQIMASRTIIVTAPDRRKANAVQRSLEGPVTNMVPSSILQRHPDTHVFLDSESASLLTGKRTRTKVALAS
ncbi:MAG TPA: glucosamine-6-phosphate deaminase [Opitutaceae bacterium]|nr:glucosamine-6-phosphate deaminase [Opitutaceae bacterium]